MVGSRRTKTALVGCGTISERHLTAIGLAADELELVGVCDLVPEKARAAGEFHGVPWFVDFASMLRQTTPELVAICTPSGLHPQHARTAFHADCHVVVEKPIGVALPPVDRLLSEQRRRGRHLFVVTQNRFNPPVQALKRALERGLLGAINLVHANLFWHRPQAYYDRAAWRGTWRLDGGPFLNQGSHYADALLWLLGPVESVMAQTARLRRQIETEDVGAATLRFRSGAIGSMSVTVLAHPTNLEGSVTVLGERGTVRIGGPALNRLELWLADEPPDVAPEVSVGNAPADVYGNGHAAFYRAVTEVLAGREPYGNDALMGRRTLALILAIYRSARTGRRVVLPDDP